VQRLGIFGGTFDPVHRGHLAIADAATSQFLLDQVRFVPVGVPPHRAQPLASAQHRFAMLQYATAASPTFVVDDWELRQSSMTYTYLTLQYFREQSDATLYFLMGMDSLLQFMQWREWRRILAISHLVVYRREGIDLDEVPLELRSRVVETYDKESISSSKKRCGAIYILDAEEVRVSSTQLRKSTRDIESKVGELVPPAVLNYIQQNRLYSYA